MLPNLPDAAPLCVFARIPVRKEIQFVAIARNITEFVWTFPGKAISRNCPLNFVIFPHDRRCFPSEAGHILIIVAGVVSPHWIDLVWRQHDGVDAS